MQLFLIILKNYNLKPLNVEKENIKHQTVKVNNWLLVQSPALVAAILAAIFSFQTMWMSWSVTEGFKLWNPITTLISSLLLHIVQKEKISPKIAAKVAGVNWPLKWVKEAG